MSELHPTSSSGRSRQKPTPRADAPARTRNPRGSSSRSVREKQERRPRQKGETYEVHSINRPANPQPTPQPQQGSRRLTIVLFVFAAAMLIILISLVVNVSRCSSERKEQAAREQQELVEAEAKPDPVTVNVMMVGDILMHRGIWQSALQDDGSYNFDHIFAHIKDDLAAADLKMLDQETVLTSTDADTWSGYPLFNSAQQVGDAEAKAGFNMILSASNHKMDQGTDGVKAEVEFWRTKHPEVQVAGIVMPGKETAAETGAVIYEKDGFKIAVLNYTEDLNGNSDPQDAVEEIDKKQMEAEIKEAEKNADITIVCPHWGEENNEKPTAAQKELAQLMLSWGVDVVFGNHPHVVEPIEVMTDDDGHTMVCFYSVGNYISTMIDPINLIGGIGKVTLVKDSDGKASVTGFGFVPLITHRGYGKNMTTYRLKDYTDALNETNYWREDDPGLSPKEADETLSQLLGAGYNSKTHELKATLDAKGNVTYE